MVTELESFLNYSVDAESQAGRPIAKKYKVTGFPTLVFLSPDGSLRDILVGYRPPAPFLAELQRIREDRNTFGALRRAIEANPDDLKARYELLQRWRDIDPDQAKEQAREIRARDPEGKTWASHALAIDGLLDKMESPTGEAALALRSLLARETAGDLLFRGWSALFYGLSASIPDAGGTAGKKHLSQMIDVGRKAWEHVAGDAIATFGNTLAWTIYENHAVCAPEDLQFAVEVARKAVAANPEDVNIIDTLACCLHVTGEKQEAQRLVHRCIQLDPDNKEWRKRLEEFTGGI